MTGEQLGGGWSAAGNHEATPGRQGYNAAAFGKAYKAAAAASAHLWVATVGYRITMPPRDMILDTDTLIGPPEIGCFICEQSYERGAETTACPGEPGGRT